MKITSALVLSVLAICVNVSSAAETGDEFIGPWRGRYADAVVDSVYFELYLWRQRPGVLFGIAQYGENGCWKKLIQIPGRRIPEEGDAQPLWFEERADPPNSSCGHIRGIGTVLIGRRKNDAIGLSSATIEWLRLDRDESPLAEGKLQGLPQSREMEQAVRNQLRQMPPSVKSQ